MKKNILPLRTGVGVVVLNKKNQVFVGKRKDNPKKHWQMPQGGVDQGETYLDAMKRELSEETSIKNIEILKEVNGWTEYELPDYLLGKIWKGKYRGQKQKWFIVRFLGTDKEIKYFLEEGTVEFSNNTLIILSSTITPLDSLTKEKISKMLEESKNELDKDNLNDKTRYILSHKLDSLSRINQ